MKQTETRLHKKNFLLFLVFTFIEWEDSIQFFLQTIYKHGVQNQQ